MKDNNIGVLITDHNVREKLDACERSYILNNSKIIAEGSSEDILENKKVKKENLEKSSKCSRRHLFKQSKQT